MNKTRAVLTWRYIGKVQKDHYTILPFRHTWLGSFPGPDTVMDEVCGDQLQPSDFICTIESWQKEPTAVYEDAVFRLCTQARYSQSRRYSTHRSLAAARAWADRWARKRFYYLRPANIDATG